MHAFQIEKHGLLVRKHHENCLSPQIKRNVEAYVDDLVVKTRDKSTYLEGVAETFVTYKNVHEAQSQQVRIRCPVLKVAKIFWNFRENVNIYFLYLIFLFAHISMNTISYLIHMLDVFS